MALLPQGMTIELAINEKTKKLCWRVSCSEEYIKRTMLSILEERIERAETALPLCKHTKRKHRLTKLLTAMKQLEQRCKTELKAVDNGSECPNCSGGDYDDYFAGEAFKHRVCNSCSILYDAQDVKSTDLPKRLEGS